MPRALLSRGQKNLPPKRYSILTIPLLDSHHGVTRYPRATAVLAIYPFNRFVLYFDYIPPISGYE